MGLTVASLDELDPAVVEQMQATFQELLQEKFPEVELARGPNHDLIHFLAGGVSGAINRTEIKRVLDSRSLLAVRSNPTLSDDEIVDHLLSNLLISRKTGTRATGEFAIVVEGSTSVVVAADAAYFANGVEFRIDVPIVAKPPGSEILGPDDRLMTPRGDGTYEFAVPATASEVGETGNIRRNTRLAPDVPPARFVTAYATKDFSGGRTDETNADLLSRVDEGVPAKVMAGRKNIVSLFKDQAVFADTRHYSIIGMGQAEMTRDQHTIFPASGGGRVDVYARTTALPKAVQLTKTCTLIEKRTASSVWQFSLTRDDAPGFYEVVQIRRPADAADVASYEILSDTRGFDLDDDSWQPDVLTALEAAYSRYQTAVIQFEDVDTAVANLTVGDTAEYVVGALTMPLIRELQEFAGGIDHGPLAGDVLLRACVPCFLGINFDVMKAANETAPSLDPIRTAVADFVNSLNFPGVLYASQISEVVHAQLDGTMALGPIDMHGRIRRMDGTNAYVRHSQVLTLPDAPSRLTTPRTVTFFLDPQDVGVAVRNRG